MSERERLKQLASIKAEIDELICVDEPTLYTRLRLAQLNAERSALLQSREATHG